MANPNQIKTQASQAGKIASTALGLLAPQTVLARTVNRDFEREFVGGVGSTVNVRRPFAFAGRNRAYGAGTAVTVDAISEPAVQAVSISKMLYSAVVVNDEEMNFEVEDFAAQILKPQVDAVAYDIEKEVAASINAAQVAGVGWGSDFTGALADAREVLGLHGVAASSLVCAVAPDVAASMLKSNALKDASQAGSADALRNANIGRLYGIDVFESPLITAGTGVVYHRDAFTLVLRAPGVPDGVAFGQSVSGNGFALRWIRDYDSSVLQDRSIVSTFIGTATMTLTERKPDGSVSTYTPAIKITANGS